MPGFVAQAGDPQTKANHGDFEGLGTVAAAYGSTSSSPESTTYTKYLVAMANAIHETATGELTGTDTNGSQFFVMLDDAPLPPYYSLLGEVVERHRGGRCHRPGAHQWRPMNVPGPGDHRGDRAGPVPQAS